MPLFTGQMTQMLAGTPLGGALPDGAKLAMQTGTIARTDLQPAPLKPAWILAGTPSARSLSLGEAADGNFSFGLWDCSAGQFKFIFGCDEFVHILEGEVTVVATGMELHLRPDDVAFFPKGLTSCWTVHGYVKKLAIFRSVQRGWLERIVGKVKREWRKLLCLSSVDQGVNKRRTGHLPMAAPAPNGRASDAHNTKCLSRPAEKCRRVTP